MIIFLLFKPVMAVKDAVFKSATMSDVVLPRMAGAVESLDSLACDRLDTLNAAVPAISEPTPQLLQTTRKAASGYWAALENYFASFTVAQVCNIRRFLTWNFKICKTSLCS